MPQVNRARPNARLIFGICTAGMLVLSAACLAAEDRHEAPDAEPRHEVQDAEARHEVQDAEARREVEDAEKRREVSEAESR